MLSPNDETNVLVLSKTSDKSKTEKMTSNHANTEEKGPPSANGKWKKYMCSYCNRAFSRSEHRTRHERSHTKERPFHCPKCPSTFVRRDLLLRHDRTVHSSGKFDKSQGLSNGNLRQLSNNKSGENAVEALVSLAADNPSSSCIRPEPQSGKTSFDANSRKLSIENHKGSFNERLHLPRLSKDVDYDAALAMTNLHSGGPASKGSSTRKPNLQENHIYTEMVSNLIQNKDNSPIQTRFSYGPGSQQNSTDSVNLLSNPFGNDLRLNVSSTPQSSAPISTAEQNGTIGSFLADRQHRYRRIPQFSKDDGIGHLLRFFVNSSNDHSTGLETNDNEISLSKLMINRYLSSYFNFFHPQHPFLHLQTFDVVNASPALIFAICAIGALLCHEEPMAFTLNQHSKLILSSIDEMDRNNQLMSGNVPPLWVSQSLLLCVIYASHVGDPCQMEFIRTGSISLSSNALRTVNQEQMKWKSIVGLPSWSDWVQHESIKRTCLNIFRVVNGLTTLLNIAPSITSSQIEETGIELPCSEFLWSFEIINEDQWRTIYSKETVMFYDKIMDWILNANNTQYNETDIRLGVFAITIVTSAIYLRQNNEIRNEDSFQKYSMIRKKWEKIMHNEADFMWFDNSNNCLKSLQSSYPIGLESMASLWLKDYHHHPLYKSNLLRLFAAEANVRGMDNSAVQDMLRYCVPQDITSAAIATLNGFIRTGVLKNEQIVGFIIESFSVIFKDFLLCGTNSVRDGQMVQASALIEDMPYGLHVALIVIFWCFQKEEELSSIRQNSHGSTDSSESIKSPINGISGANEVFKLIERLCIESGTLDRFRQYNQLSRARVSASLCLLYADVLETAKSWGFSTILCSSMKSLAYILLSHRTSITINATEKSIKSEERFNEFQSNNSGFISSNNSGFMSFSASSMSKSSSPIYKPGYRHDIFKDNSSTTSPHSTTSTAVNRVIFSKPVVM